MNKSVAVIGVLGGLFLLSKRAKAAPLPRIDTTGPAKFEPDFGHTITPVAGTMPIAGVKTPNQSAPPSTVSDAKGKSVVLQQGLTVSAPPAPPATPRVLVAVTDPARYRAGNGSTYLVGAIQPNNVAANSISAWVTEQDVATVQGWAADRRIYTYEFGVGAGASGMLASTWLERYPAGSLAPIIIA